jgi:hypothetical protein
MPLESLFPYLRGAMFSLVGLRLRHPELSDEVVADIDRRREMLQRYSEAATATFKLRKERESGQA